jgi:hypothetical protein
MRIPMYGTVLLTSALMLSGVAAWGQAATSEKRAPTSFEIAITYDASRTNVISGNSFWMQGGSVQMHGQFWHGLGVVADVAGLHTNSINDSAVGLDMVTATFGPRYTWPVRSARYSFFGQALAGEANGINSVFPGVSQASSTADGLAVQLGGGMNVNLKRHLAIRAFEADWLRTQLPNSTTSVQNNLRLGAGIVFVFRKY